MYLERIENHLKIMKKIENLLTKDPTISLLIKGILNASIMRKGITLNLNVKLNQRVKLEIEQIIGIFDF